MQGPAPVAAATTRRHKSVEEEAEGGRAKVPTETVEAAGEGEYRIVGKSD